MEQQNPESDYLAQEQARQAAGQPPQTPPVYPVSTSGQIAQRMLDIHRAAMIPAPRPVIDEAVRAQQRPAAVPTGLDPAKPVDYLRLYPQQINAEYLAPMSAVIEAFLADRDVDALVAYGMNINQAYGVELGRRAAAVIHGAQPVLTTLTGNASVDGSPADGATANAATFVALDQYGSPLVITLDITGTGCMVSGATVTTDGTGSAAVDATSDTPGAATVTAASAGLTADVALTFAEVPAP